MAAVNVVMPSPILWYMRMKMEVVLQKGNMYLVSFLAACGRRSFFPLGLGSLLFFVSMLDFQAVFVYGAFRNTKNRGRTRAVILLRKQQLRL